MRRTCGKSTGEFIAAFRGLGRTELGRGRRKEEEYEKRRRSGEGCEKADWKRRLRKEAHGKEQRGTIRSSEGQGGADKTREEGKRRWKKGKCRKKKGIRVRRERRQRRWHVS